MKVLVAYMSKTGNTRKVAEAIYDGIKQDKELKKIEDVTDGGSYDFYFLGFPTHMEGPDKKTKELLQKHCVAGRNVALFVTHGAPEDAPEVPQWMALFKKEAANANLVGFFDCQGQMSKVVKFFLRTSTKKKYRDWGKMDNSQGQPDANRLEKARAFARETMLRVK